jgi:hypothetical protein
MHLASKSFWESGQESGRLVTEQNMRALSLDRHEWKDFAVCIWQWLVDELALPINAAMHDFWSFKAVRRRTDLLHHHTHKLQLWALFLLQVYSLTIEMSGPTFWFAAFLIGEYLVLFNHGFNERRSTNRLPPGATCDIPQRACGARAARYP